MRKAMSAPFETALAGALLDTTQPVPDGITVRNAAVLTRRFAVHRNNVTASLVNALRSRFPIVEKIVGEDFFAAMARVFVTEHPPRTPVLATYGDAFPGFVATFDPAREVAYLADVARLELARSRAYHAADAAPLGAAQFAARDAAAVSGIRVNLHPSLQVVRSPHPIVTIWAMNSGGQELAPIDDWRGEDALVVRPQLDVEVRLLPPGGAVFLLALAAGRPIGEAAAAARADHPDFDLTLNLAALMGSGLVQDIVRDILQDGVQDIVQGVAVAKPEQHGLP
jgi:hypothetical protein